MHVKMMKSVYEQRNEKILEMLETFKSVTSKCGNKMNYSYYNYTYSVHKHLSSLHYFVLH